MKLAIRNFLGAKSVDIDIGDGITAIYGTNEQGKSSTLLAAAAALSGNPMIGGTTKKECKLLIHDGAEAAIVIVGDDENKTTLRYTEGEVKSESLGRPPLASAIACGLENIVDMTPEDRARLLIKTLKSEPGVDDLKMLLLEQGWREEPAAKTAAETMEQIAALGWDGAHKKAVAAGQELKGAWRAITGEQYGSAKAGSWRPAGYPADLDMKTLPELQTIYDEAVKKQNEATVSSANNQANRALREASAARQDELAAAEAEALAALKKAETAHEKAAKALADSSLAGYVGYKCPHCDKTVTLVKDAKGDNVLIKFEKDLPPDEKKEVLHAHAAASGKESKAASELTAARQALASAKAATAQAAADALWLSENPATETVYTGPTADTAKQAVVVAARNLAWAQKVKAAFVEHRKIVANQTLIDALAPTGLQQKKLAAALELFNNQLADISNACKWPAVRIEPDVLTPSWGGRPFLWLAESAKWRVRVVLRLALAFLEKAEVVIIDGADILMVKHRNNLFNYLAYDYGTPVLIGVSVGKPDRDLGAIDLKKHKMGRSYWIAGGTTVALEVEQNKHVV